MAGAEAPEMTVVLCTYNRADRVAEPIEAVLAEAEVALELVVVDDGSTDATPTTLAGFDDLRLRVLRRPNGGLCRARNTGLAAARGRWTVFLDDDDVPEPGWLATLAGLARQPGVGVSCCGGTIVDGDGRFEEVHEVEPLGEPFGDAVGSYLPGTFAARTDLLRQAGGYLEGLGAAHQFELFVRLLAAVSELGLEVASSNTSVIRLERRRAEDRPVVNPRLLYDGTRWILARHGPAFAGQRRIVADFEAVVGAAAARLGDWPVARRRFVRGVRSRPTSARQWGRATLATLPLARSRVWQRHGAWATHHADEAGILRQLPKRRSEVQGRELFLPWRYRENLPASSDSDGMPYWSEGMASSDARNQVPVYRLAARLARRGRWSPVLDVGCGSGQKLATCFEGDTVGVDQPSGIALAAEQYPERDWIEGDFADDALWERVASLRPGLTICSDVIEHVEDPVTLLHRLAEVSAGAPVMLSTPDRAVYDPERPTGPPSNPRHIREWTSDQFELLLQSTGFEVERDWHLLPRSYSLTRTELNRSVYRGLTLKAVPDRRSCMVFLVRAT